MGGIKETGKNGDKRKKEGEGRGRKTRPSIEIAGYTPLRNRRMPPTAALTSH